MKCHNENCVNEEESRGLCHKCYCTAYYYVRKGITTWDKLKEDGTVLDSKRTRDCAWANKIKNSATGNEIKEIKQSQAQVDSND
jgi:hypothetical protein